jgi:NAD(P)-dependent dehydrogenase (short-subunit alcohol dehydrogenase family)
VIGGAGFATAGAAIAPASSAAQAAATAVLVINLIDTHPFVPCGAPTRHPFDDAIVRRPSRKRLDRQPTTKQVLKLRSGRRGGRMGELEGKVAVITGAGSGMGRASSGIFVREGARVLAVDISGRQQETADALGAAVVPFQADVSNEASVEAMFAAAVDAFGKVDAVLNVAGIAGAGRFADVTIDDYERMMAVNLRGVFLGTKHAIRTMVPTGGGTIVNWSSTGGLNAASLPVSVYSATKAGVISFTKAAAVEYADAGIRANVICPGFVETEMSGGPGAAKRFPQVVGGQAIKRGAHPDEIAEVASFLSSDRSSFMTGAVVPVDGGQAARLA